MVHLFEDVETLKTSKRPNNSATRPSKDPVAYELAFEALRPTARRTEPEECVWVDTSLKSVPASWIPFHPEDC